MGNKKIQLSLGCGRKSEEGFVGLDIENFEHNKLWDATKDPIPYADNSVDFIKAHNFVEHIERKHWKNLFNECHRVLKPSGQLEIVVPDAAKDMDLAMADVTHVSLFVMNCLKYIAGERPRNADYGYKHWYIDMQRHMDDVDDRLIFALLRPNK